MAKRKIPRIDSEDTIEKIEVKQLSSLAGEIQKFIDEFVDTSLQKYEIKITMDRQGRIEGRYCITKLVDKHPLATTYLTECRDVKGGDNYAESYLIKELLDTYMNSSSTLELSPVKVATALYRGESVGHAVQIYPETPYGAKIEISGLRGEPSEFFKYFVRASHVINRLTPHIKAEIELFGNTYEGTYHYPELGFKIDIKPGIVPGGKLVKYIDIHYREVLGDGELYVSMRYKKT